MIKSRRNKIGTVGLTQNTRQSEALRPDYFQFDERQLHQLLHSIAEFSKHVRYINLDNKDAGDWSRFFEKDLAFVLSEIACVKTEEFDRSYKQLHKAAEYAEPGANQMTLVEECFLLCWEKYLLINDWFVRTKSEIEHLKQNPLEPHLSSAIQSKLIPHLHFLRSYHSFFSSIDDHGLLSVDTEEAFDPIWRTTGDYERMTLDANGIASFLSQLHKAQKAFISTLTHFQYIAPRLLKETVEHYPYHQPHTSLIISFLHIYKYVQGDINEVLRRNLEHYYMEVLGQEPRTAEGDLTYLCFKLGGHVRQAALKAGTLLNANVGDDGKHTLYRVTRDTNISHAELWRVLVLHAANNPSIGIGTSFKDVSNIYASEILIDDKGFVVDSMRNAALAFPFGRDQADISLKNRDMVQGDVGFSISSSVFLLSEGRRDVDLIFRFDLKSMTSLVSFIEEVAAQNQLTADGAFQRILNDIFNIRITTPKGWFEVERYTIQRTQSWTDGELKISFNIDISEPAFSSYDPELHGKGYDTHWPVAEFLISSRYAMYGYSYLKDLKINTCRISADVQGVKGLSFFNDQGQLDIQSPFYPLGSNPRLGAYFMVGHEELFVKQIDGFSLDIQWHNLPRKDGGLETHYAAYNQGIDNSSFQVALSSLSEYQFKPVDQSLIQHFSLFDYDKEAARLSSHKRFEDIDIEVLRMKPEYGGVDVSEYTAKTKTGFLKFELVAPSVGFGFDLYPKLFADAVVKNAQSSGGLLGPKETLKVDVPEEPFAPQIRSVSLSYQASSTLTFKAENVADNNALSGDQFVHIEPFGKRTIFQEGLPLKRELLAQYNDEGYLYLGLKQLSPPQQVSFFFQLEHNSVNAVNYSDIPKLKWKYLSGNEWIELNKNQVLEDGTNNFTTSGVVELNLPSDIDTIHDVLPTGLYWIAVVAPRNTQILSKVEFIRTNAARVVWHPTNPSDSWENNIPAETISGFAQSRSDITSVYQPFRSYRGRGQEDDHSFFTRVAERLKHKNRIVTAEDVERVALDHFPDLFQVVALTNASFPKYVKPGEIKLVVIPYLKEVNKLILPRVDYNKLELIQKQLQALVSPFVNVKVINPIYEKVRVNCAIQFTGDLGVGEYLAMLEMDIAGFICPWIKAAQKEMTLGGGIDRAAISSFIQSLSYVRFVARLSIVVLHFKDGEYSISDTASEGGRMNKIMSSTPWSVLVPDDEHEITISERMVKGKPIETKIESMKVGADFVITEESTEDVEYPFFDHEKDVFYSIKIDL